MLHGAPPVSPSESDALSRFQEDLVARQGEHEQQLLELLQDLGQALGGRLDRLELCLRGCEERVASTEKAFEVITEGLEMMDGSARVGTRSAVLTSKGGTKFSFDPAAQLIPSGSPDADRSPAGSDGFRELEGEQLSNPRCTFGPGGFCNPEPEEGFREVDEQQLAGHRFTFGPMAATSETAQKLDIDTNCDDSSTATALLSRQNSELATEKPRALSLRLAAGMAELARSHAASAVSFEALRSRVDGRDVSFMQPDEAVAQKLYASVEELSQRVNTVRDSQSLAMQELREVCTATVRAETGLEVQQTRLEELASDLESLGAMQESLMEPRRLEQLLTGSEAWRKLELCFAAFEETVAADTKSVSCDLASLLSRLQSLELGLEEGLGCVLRGSSEDVSGVADKADVLAKIVSDTVQRSVGCSVSDTAVPPKPLGPRIATGLKLPTEALQAGCNGGGEGVLKFLAELERRLMERLDALDPLAASLGDEREERRTALSQLRSLLKTHVEQQRRDLIQAGEDVGVALRDVLAKAVKDMRRDGERWVQDAVATRFSFSEGDKPASSLGSPARHGYPRGGQGPMPVASPEGSRRVPALNLPGAMSPGVTSPRTPQSVAWRVPKSAQATQPLERRDAPRCAPVGSGRVSQEALLRANLALSPFPTASACGAQAGSPPRAVTPCCSFATQSR